LLRRVVCIGMGDIARGRGHIPLSGEPMDVWGIRQGEGPQDQTICFKCWPLFHLTFLFAPNASLQLLPEAGAQRTLEAVSCKALFGEVLACRDWSLTPGRWSHRLINDGTISRRGDGFAARTRGLQPCLFGLQDLA
jgi:hypothetical protein